MPEEALGLYERNWRHVDTPRSIPPSARSSTRSRSISAEGGSLFERAHHQRIAALLRALDADLLAANSCWFGGGTAMALRYGEYRESVDIDSSCPNQGLPRAARAADRGG